MYYKIFFSLAGKYDLAALDYNKDLLFIRNLFLEIVSNTIEYK
jgi:hypothetical protein